MAEGGPRMHAFLRSRLALGILAVFGWQAFAHPRSAEAISGRPLTIRIYSVSDVSPRTLNHAIQDATRILATAGVDAIWQRGPIGATESQLVDLSVRAAEKGLGYRTRGYIVIVIVRGVPARCFPGALGYALPDAQTGANATIFYDRIERLAEPGAIDLATALGGAMAHEVGHVLLGSTEHSRSGIMKAVLNEHDFRMSPLAAVGFTASQREVIRKRLFVQ